jgi:hypothetical protein
VCTIRTSFLLTFPARKPNQPAAVRVIRAMRGGAQAKLVLADDEHLYVVKFTNNPQQRRTLINEVIATTLLQALGLPAADFSPIAFDTMFLRDQPITLDFGSRSIDVPTGLHYGSRCPFLTRGISQVIYDQLPRAILRTTGVAAAFLGAYVADQWMANTDKRQAIFYRNPIQQWQVQLIDHGQMFDGTFWRFVNSFDWATFVDPVVYEGVKSFDEVNVWVERAMALRHEVFEAAFRSVPEEWIEDDGEALQRLLKQLIERGRNLSRIVEQAMSHEKSPFSATLLPLR